MKSTIVDILKKIDIHNEEYQFDELLEFLNLMSSDPRSHMKLYELKEEEYIAHFSWQSRNRWKIDYPVELHKVHKQRYVTKQQCLSFLKKVYKKKEIRVEDNFIDVPIRHFTLDEMLEFKHEDKMMLKGLDPDLNKPKVKPVYVENKLTSEEVTTKDKASRKIDFRGGVVDEIVPVKSKSVSKNKKSKPNTTDKNNFRGVSVDEKLSIKNKFSSKKEVAKVINEKEGKSKVSASKEELVVNKPLPKKDVSKLVVEKEIKPETTVEKPVAIENKPLSKKKEVVAPVKVKKSKLKTNQVMGERLNTKQKMPKEVKKPEEKTIKNKSEDDGSFFSI